MKNWVWTLFVFLVTFSVIFFLDLSYTGMFWVILPVLIVVFIAGSFHYSFRESLRPEAIPDTGYDRRVKDTERSMKDLPSGFKLIDRFFLKAVPDSVTYAFLHEKEPVIGCIYHFGAKMAVDFVTIYHDDYSLTTNDTIDGGMAPRPEKNFIQLFPGYTYQKLFEKHMESHAYLVGKNLRPRAIYSGEFRELFMKEYRAQGDYIRQKPFWPLLLLYRTVFKYGKRFAVPVRKQIESGIIHPVFK